MPSGDVEIRPFDKPDWRSFPQHGSNVEFKVLIHEQDRFLMTMLRFSEDATLSGHVGDSYAEAFCIEGSGFVSVGEDTSAFESGQRFLLPKGINHKLWTEGSPMLVLVVNRAEPDE